MRVISLISVPFVALALCGCPGANSTNPWESGDCTINLCGTGGGDPSGSAVGTGSGTGVGGNGGSSTGVGGTDNSGGSGGGEPVDHCIDLLAALEDALSHAQECIPGSDMPQCKVFLDGICCQVPVNGDQTAIQVYLAALDAAKKANCPCPLPPPVDCQINPTASCVADGEDTGHCVIDPP